MTTPLIDATRPTRDWPADLRPHVGEHRLIELALEGAQIVGERLPRPEGIAEDQPSPRLLLTLLTYCYAAAIYGSEDIEWACDKDPSVHYLCAKTPPEQEDIRRFRRANRPSIEACLVWIYGQACPAKDPGHSLADFVRQKLELAIMMDTASCE